LKYEERNELDLTGNPITEKQLADLQKELPDFSISF